MKSNKITRRSFLLGLGTVSAAAVLTACGSSSSTAASGAASGSTASAGGDTVYRTLDEIKADGKRELTFVTLPMLHWPDSMADRKSVV